MRSNFGEFLNALRKSKGLTQQAVADLLGVSNKTVSSWETGASCPDISMLPAIAELFGVTCDELLRGERIAPTEPQGRTEEKREKALARMLASRRNAAVCSFWGSVGLYLLAVIVTLLIGCAVLESLIGFFVGMIFLLGGLFLNLIHYKMLRLSLGQEDFESASLNRCLRLIAARQRACLILAAATLGILLPHALVPVHYGLNLAPALLYGAIGGAAAGLIAFVGGAIVRSAHRRYLETPQKFSWTLKHGVFPYSAICMVCAAIFIGIGAYYAIHPQPIGGPNTLVCNTYAQLVGQLQAGAPFSEYEHTLSESSMLPSTLDEAALQADITQENLFYDYTFTERGASYFFSEFPEAYLNSYAVDVVENGYLVHVPVLTLFLPEGETLCVAVWSAEYQADLNDLSAQITHFIIAEEEELAHDIYALHLQFGVPLCRQTPTRAYRLSMICFFAGAAALTVLLLGGYTAIYLTRRKKFLQTLQQKDDNTQGSPSAAE